jgi:hypothetical protein
MVHPDSALRYVNDKIGYGVVATRLIPRGSITWVLDDLDQAFTPQEANRISDFLKPALEKYSFMDATGKLILCWDHARFINHSCAPSCMSTAFNFELAVRDIQPGEELTDDYATLNLARDFECQCHSARCRHTVHPDDFLKYVVEWDSIVAKVFPLVKSVQQPLWPLVKEKDEVESVLAARATMPSIAVQYRKSEV